MSQASYELVAIPPARSELSAVPEEPQDRLRTYIDQAAENADPADVSPVVRLTDQDELLFRVRAGRYRAIIGRDGAKLALLWAGHRDNCYDDKLDLAVKRFNSGEAA